MHGYELFLYDYMHIYGQVQPEVHAYMVWNDITVVEARIYKLGCMHGLVT